MTSAAKLKKVRAVNAGPKSGPAQARRRLYGNAITRINNAIEHRYPLESIALLESMMADRLEARLAWLHQQGVNKREFSTLGKLTQELCSALSNESDEAKSVYEAIKAWANRRNEALHQMAKLVEDDPKDWKARLREAQATAEAGVPLFNKVTALVRKLNRPPKPVVAATQPRN
ncbi:hypothetical protein [Rhodoferax sp.]|uniref:hypothetical protein n=1 Tax=Rhodoferax sp. TaxID=50421 RepID=UPI00262ED909|nr:hypothetical protein [Rhodoferax sp.]MDD2919324.1 hypothetical protein [Rhodoferax sp.]